MNYAFPHVAGRLFDTILAIEPQFYFRMLESLGPRIITGIKAESEGKPFYEHKREAARTRLLGALGGQMVDANGMGEYLLTPHGVAVIPVIGPLSARFDWLAQLCGFCTYDGLKETFNSAMVNDRVRAVMFDYDTPGGEVVGCFDLARYILSMRDKGKPIYSVANGMACSAGYALAGSGGKFYATSMSYVGSIGVVAVHADYSEQDKERGIKYTAIFSGKHKVDGWSHAPLSADVKKRWQEDIDGARRAFAGLVGSYGRIDQKGALDTEADVYRDEEAVDLKLVDGIKSFDDVYDEIVGLVDRRSSSGTFAASSGQPQHGEGSMNVQTPAGGDPANNGNQPAPPAATTAAPPATPDPRIAEAQQAAAAATVETERVTKISNLCVIAGRADLIAGFIKDKSTPDAVQASLLAFRATKTDANPIDPTGKAPDAPPAGNYGWDAIVDRQNAASNVKAQRM